MRKLLIVFFILFALTAHAGQQLVNLSLTSNLTDTKSNLTAGGLIRNSDATYVNSAGVLSYSRGTRINYLLYSEDTSNAAWVGGTVQTVAVSLGTYSLAVYKTGATLTAAATTAAITPLAGLVASVGTPIYFTVTSAGNITITTDTTNPQGSLEKLPSGNVIGSDLMDQEALTARTAGYTLVVGTIYKIVSRATLDFTTVGAADNTAGTYFICHTASALGAGDAASDVTTPAKGQFHGTAMLAGSTELITNGGFETITDAGPPVNFGTWSETIGGTDTITDPGSGYLGSHSATLTNVDSGVTFVDQDITTTANKLYKLEFYTKGDATVAGRYNVYNNSTPGDIVALGTTGVTSATYTKVTKYFYTPTSCVSVKISLYAPSAAGAASFDYVSVRQVQTAWTRYGTSTLEIDETDGSGGALKITYVDQVNGASLVMRNSADQTDDMTVGETYQVSFKAKVSAGNSVVVNTNPNDGTNVTSATITETSLTQKTLYHKCIATNDKIDFSGLGAGESIWIDDLTIKAAPDLAYLSPGTYTATSGSTKEIPGEDRIGLAPDGLPALLVEGEATNYVTYSCDFTNAAWVKSNITPLKNQTGPDGVASSASLLTAGAANGTALFTVADGGTATNKTFSVWLKRVTGTGNIDLTDNNGTNWTTRSVTSTWTKFTLAARSQAIPIVGIRIVTSGDAVAACLAQNEIPAFSTSGIYTNGCPVTRLTEAGSATNGYSWTIGSALSTALGLKGTMLVDIIPGHSAAGGSGAAVGRVSVSDTAASLLYYNYTNTRFEAADGTNTPNYTLSIVTNTPYTKAVRWDETANGGAGYLQLAYKDAGTWYTATAGSQRTAFDGGFTIGATTKLRLGIGSEYPFWIRNIRFYDGWVKDANLDAPIKGGLFPILPLNKKVKGYEY